MAVLMEDSAACAGVLMAVSGIGMTNVTNTLRYNSRRYPWKTKGRRGGMGMVGRRRAAALRVCND